MVEKEKDAKKLVRTRGEKESLPYKFMKLKNLRLLVQRLVLISPATDVEKMLEEGGEVTDNDDEKPI